MGRREVRARVFPVGRVLVRGASMAPALHDGDVLLVRWRRAGAVCSGDVVVVQLPGRPLAVKRVVEVPTDGVAVEVPTDGVAVEGDNPYGSTDSRELGPLPVDAIRGRALCRIWPRPGRIPPRASLVRKR